MEMFEYVAVLTSIIIGLAITHLLQGTARLIQHPDTGRPYWVHLTWALYMFLNSVFWWWWEFRLTRIEVWTFQMYIFVILFAVTLYLLCALLYPVSLDGYDGFKDYFYSRRRWFFGLSIVFLLIDVGDTLLKGTAYFASLGPEYIVVRTLKLALCGIAIRSRNEGFHGFFAVASLLYQVSWALRFYDTVA
jgi:hypothetical protein